MGIFSPSLPPCAILQAMQQPAASTPSPTTPNFAGLLAALAAPAPPPADHPSSWKDDDLAADVATLSYEHALRAHARYKPSNSDAWLKPQPTGSIAGGTAPPDAPAVSGAMPTQPAAAAWNADGSADQQAPAQHSQPTAPDSPRKLASVTIRMTGEECAQLHQRAAEAGLTVSAYLRSCTFEAEALRAEVKETLARLRAAASAEKPAAPPPARHSRRGRLARLLMPWRSGSGAARA